jgi:hypothetical protein
MFRRTPRYCTCHGARKGSPDDRRVHQRTREQFRALGERPPRVRYWASPPAPRRR